MFRGRRAWFSQSVSPALRDLWAAEGGAISAPRAAEFLFSSDASHPDTQRIHQSLDYMEGKATVFHSCYLSANASASSEMKQTVALGHFILPPACVQEEIRQKLGHFIWEQMSDSLMEQLDELTPDEIKSRIKEDEQRIKGKRVLDDSDKENRVLKTPMGGKLAYCPLQDYPVNNMVTADRYERFLNLMGNFFSSEAKVALKKLENEEAERKRQHEREERQREREEEERKREHEDRERERQHRERMHQRELEDKAKEREARCQMQEREHEEQEKQRQHEKIIAELHNRNLELRILRLTGFSSNKSSLQPFLFRTASSSILRPGMPDDVEDSDGNKNDDDSDDLDSLY